MKCAYIFASESCAVDQLLGSFCAYNMLDRLIMPAAPFLLPKVTISALFVKEAKDKAKEPCFMQINVNGKSFFNQQAEIEFHGTSKINRNIMILQGLVVPEIGVLEFVAEKNTVVLARWEVVIESLGTPVVQNVSAPPPKTTAASSPSKRAKSGN